MALTEDEAKTKQCHRGHSGPGVYVMEDGCPVYYCIGSACMAWQWAYDSEFKVFFDQNGDRFEANTINRLNEAEEKKYKPFIPTAGYCGLVK